MNSTVTIYTLAHEAPLPDLPEDPSIFIAKHFQYDLTSEEPTPVLDSALSSFPPSVEPSTLTYTIITGIPTEEITLSYGLRTEVPTLVLNYE